jgi:hypothetical protein
VSVAVHEIKGDTEQCMPGEALLGVLELDYTTRL